ncbi:hypothetical protein FA13DRAFT_1799917 [Coprinellus micaceus]|uniref:Uncharacterized protein n=1 Tax=Coprinellus micaceus TaxID=71717 RepID=A0A4Y7SHL8_COPMI|nr:hypothetical protein FA13DRAFT_1799917 [Coprinellus micaceus]
METPPVANVIQGFGTTNRWLLYASLMFSPAQALSGMNSNSPTGVGFLAYHVYQQHTWYIAARDKQLHALSMLPIYFNMTYSLTYLFGVPSGNVVSISDTIESAIAVIAALALGFVLPWTPIPEDTWEDFVVWRDTALLWGSVAALVMVWPFILWTELIVKNNIVSEMDMISVYLFVAQIVALVGPRIAELVWEGLVSYFGCSRWSRRKQELEQSVLPITANSDLKKLGEPSDEKQK